MPMYTVAVGNTDGPVPHELEQSIQRSACHSFRPQSSQSSCCHGCGDLRLPHVLATDQCPAPWSPDPHCSVAVKLPLLLTGTPSLREPMSSSPTHPSPVPLLSSLTSPTWGEHITPKVPNSALSWSPILLLPTEPRDLTCVLSMS